MTDRAMPLVDGAPACPFVAFEDDRDARATSPDHRHRCYAEIRPAPRALAHQEAYCLSSAFPVCPTFQDWARREAAQAKTAGTAAAAAAAAAGAGNAEDPDLGSEPGSPRSSGSTGSAGSMERNPPRNWAAPPPWLSSRDGEPDDGDEPDVAIQPPPRGGGLAGSFADRLAGGSSQATPARPPTSSPAGPPPVAPPVMPPAPPRWRDDGLGDDDEDDDDAWSRRPAGPAARGRRSGRDDRAAAGAALPGPSWERPRRLEAYPTLKTRMGLPSLSLPPLLVAVAAVVIAAVALFFLPALLGIGNPPGAGSATNTPGASTAASGSPAPPTDTPAPTQQIYLVQEGDTMSKIANRFGVTLQALIDANKGNIPNPDVLQIDQEVIIPVAAPTTLPDAGASPSP